MDIQSGVFMLASILPIAMPVLRKCSPASARFYTKVRRVRQLYDNEYAYTPLGYIRF